MAIPTRPAGWPLWSIVLAGLVLVSIAGGLIYVGRSWEPVHALMRWMGRGRHQQAQVQEVAKPAAFDAGTNGASRIYLPTSDDTWKKEQAKLQRMLEAQQEQNKKILEELEAIKRRKIEHTEKTEKKEPKRERAKAVYVVNEQKAPASKEPLYTLPAYTYIPATLENVIVSEIEGMFTVITSRPLFDETGQHVLIPQGQRIGAKALTAELLYGNERVPGFGLSTTINGHDVDLGQAPIMDRTGTLGLTGDVNSHWLRLAWSSLVIGGLRGGQVVLQQEIGGVGGAPIAAGIARESSSQTQKRLGRAADTRPTITVASGEQVQILIPHALQLPSAGRR